MEGNNDGKKNDKIVLEHDRFFSDVQHKILVGVFGIGLVRNSLKFHHLI